jgi:hypothetical protein
MNVFMSPFGGVAELQSRDDEIWELAPGLPSAPTLSIDSVGPKDPKSVGVVGGAPAPGSESFAEHAASVRNPTSAHTVEGRNRRKRRTERGTTGKYDGDVE